MKPRTKPPFRADHVGSFLRPLALLQAREQHKAGKITAGQLREVENEAIREIVRFQEDAGLRGITDGEFRRTYFHIDFLEQLEGVEARGGLTAHFHRKEGGDLEYAPPILHVTGCVCHKNPIQLRDFQFLKSVTKQTAKVTIPSDRKSTRLNSSH